MRRYLAKYFSVQEPVLSPTGSLLAGRLFARSAMVGGLFAGGLLATMASVALEAAGCRICLQSPNICTGIPIL